MDGYEAELSLSDESSGTLVIDELDAKIHPALLRHIIMLYNDLEGKYGADPYLRRIIDWGNVGA